MFTFPMFPGASFGTQAPRQNQGAEAFDPAAFARASNFGQFASPMSAGLNPMYGAMSYAAQPVTGATVAPANVAPAAVSGAQPLPGPAQVGVGPGQPAQMQQIKRRGIIPGISIPLTGNSELPMGAPARTAQPLSERQPYPQRY